MLQSGTAAHQAILANVRDDPCVDDGTTDEFFTTIAASPAPADAEAAKCQA
jgi:hypothetical protein